SSMSRSCDPLSMNLVYSFGQVKGQIVQAFEDSAHRFVTYFKQSPELSTLEAMSNIGISRTGRHEFQGIFGFAFTIPPSSLGVELFYLRPGHQRTHPFDIHNE